MIVVIGVDANGFAGKRLGDRSLPNDGRSLQADCRAQRTGL
jgi:hypothetical protein